MQSRISRIGQVLLAVAAWLAFAAMWWWAFSQRGPLEHQLHDLAAIAVFSLFVVVVMSLWVHHNVRLYHRKGPRTHVPTGDHDYSHDTIGRPVIADFSALAHSRFVVIQVAEGPEGPTKIYEARELPSRPPQGLEESCTT